MLCVCIDERTTCILGILPSQFLGFRVWCTHSQLLKGIIAADALLGRQLNLDLSGYCSGTLVILSTRREGEEREREREREVREAGCLLEGLHSAV